MDRCQARFSMWRVCRNKPIEGAKAPYCRGHQGRMPVDVGQGSAENETLLNEDLWGYIASDLLLLECRMLALTCKFIFHILTSDRWFSAHPHYLLLYNQKGRAMVSINNTGGCERFKQYIGRGRSHQIVIDEKIQPGDEKEKTGHIELSLITLVNSYAVARHIYRMVRLRPNRVAANSSIILDCNGSNIESELKELALSRVIYQIRRKMNRRRDWLYFLSWNIKYDYLVKEIVDKLTPDIPGLAYSSQTLPNDYFVLYVTQASEVEEEESSASDD